jgi:hypothetical protein
MSHAPECSGRIYGCLTCGRRDLTIGETFDHHCVPSTATATAYSAIMKNGKQVKGWCHSRADAELVYGRRGWEIVEIEIVVPEAVA